MIRLGIDNIQANDSILKDKSFAVLVNQASVDSFFKHTAYLLDAKYPGKLKCLFTPQHGYFSDKQDNMVESDHEFEPLLEIPVYSLYSKTRVPTDKMFEGIEALVIDLPDVGTRVYTFIYTIAGCLEACKKRNIPVVVLDRPNPLGGNRVEGNLLKSEYSSFVGMFPIPMRHGLTVGEIALLFNEHFGIGAKLKVIPMTGWQRQMYFEDTGQTWIMPSPNMPTADAAYVFPGQVIWEGTNLSEGRGTTLPFSLFGASYINPFKLLKKINQDDMAGTYLRPIYFEPTSNKFAGVRVGGFQLHILDRDKYEPYRMSLSLFSSIFHEYQDAFAYKDPPYEYEYQKLPMDLILGDADVRHAIEGGEPVSSLVENWQDNIVKFSKLSSSFYLY